MIRTLTLAAMLAATQVTGETATPMVKIEKSEGRQVTAIAVLESNRDTVAGTVKTQHLLLKQLSDRRGFRAGALFRSRDGEHVILYTQWESANAWEQAAKAGADGSGLRPFSVAYLANRRGGDTLNLAQGTAPAILINVISTDPESIDKLYEFWVRGAERYWLTLPEVIGAALHRSADRRTIINIAEWTSGEAWKAAAAHAGENFAGAHGVGTSDPKLYDVVAVISR